MATAVALVSDMIFASRIRSTAEQAGCTCTVVASNDALAAALEGGGAQTLLIDLQCSTVDPIEAIRDASQQEHPPSIVAFGSHVETELLNRAGDAGANLVLPRSAFVQQLVGLLSDGV